MNTLSYIAKCSGSFGQSEKEVGPRTPAVRQVKVAP